MKENRPMYNTSRVMYNLGLTVKLLHPWIIVPSIMVYPFERQSLSAWDWHQVCPSHPYFNTKQLYQIRAVSISARMILIMPLWWQFKIHAYCPQLPADRWYFVKHRYQHGVIAIEMQKTVRNLVNWMVESMDDILKANLVSIFDEDCRPNG